MEDLKEISVKISNYKCFGNEACGYDQILPINLIIGRNNSGKSSLLDIIDYAVEPKSILHLGHKGGQPKVVLSSTLLSEELYRAFQPNISDAQIGNHREFAETLVGKRVVWEMETRGNKVISVEWDYKPQNTKKYEDEISACKVNPFSGYAFRRIQADRDILPESINLAILNQDTYLIKPNGQGATNAVQCFLNRSSLPSTLIEDNLLDDLNLIFEPDAHFTRIDVQQLQNDTWEIFLSEKEKGFIALSQSGSGLKTILLVLLFIQLLPYHEKKELSSYLFAFEELENNLHPA